MSDDLDALRKRLMEPDCGSIDYQAGYETGVDAALAALEQVGVTWCNTHGGVVHPNELQATAPNCAHVGLYRITPEPPKGS